MNTYGRGNPEVERVIAEMTALNATVAADTPKLAREAQAMVRAVESEWTPPRSVPDFVIRAAMARITGAEAPGGEPERTTGETAVWSVRGFELIALAWLTWTRGQTQRAHFWIEQWSRENDMFLAGKAAHTEEGAIQAFAVALWALAVEALIEDRPEDARRFFRRVYEVGSSFGTESHPTVLWTMAASFFTLGG